MSKGPKQSHIDYLLETIEKESDPFVSRLGPLFRETRELFVTKQISEQQVREGLQFLRIVTLQKCAAKHRVDKLLEASIEFIINPDRMIIV